MGPIRGFKRRKKASDKKVVDQNVFPFSATVASPFGSQPQPLDWWDEFSKRISEAYDVAAKAGLFQAKIC